MRALLLGLGLVICLSGQALASDEAQDGKEWNTWLESRKVYFLTGMFEGVRLGGDLAVPKAAQADKFAEKTLDKPAEKAGKSAKPKAEKTFTTEEICQDKAQAAFDLNTMRYFFGVSIKEAEDMLDKFYKDSRNQVVPVRNALIVVLRQKKGEDVSKLIEEVRKPD